MTTPEIEQEVAKLVAKPFDPENFPFDFLRAFGVSEVAIAKLQDGKDNKSDVSGVLQRSRNNIHLKTCAPGEVEATLAELRASAATAKFKAAYILATDGVVVAAEHLPTGNPIACEYNSLAYEFRFFLALAGISYTQPPKENEADFKATTRLNKLYVELLKHNPDWDTNARREDLNHFFARLIFCFFAEDTNIFFGSGLFTATIKDFSERDGSNVHEILAELFRAMNTRPEHRASAKIKPYANVFPYVNGNLFGGDDPASSKYDTPRFNQLARIHLMASGEQKWTKINPDIFGSMIQAVADDEERGSVGMHYTSVPNILKVLNPLFLDELRAKLAEAGDGKTPGSARKLLNLRHRLAHIRVFDPACGSGNFLVIAYKEMRVIEHEINVRRGEAEIESVIPISNFRGIELRHFPTEIARLALVIAQFQCDVLYRGEQLARDKVLPLAQKNWITHGNALRLDWLTVCPPDGTGVKLASDDLYDTPKDQAEIDFENAGGETYVCGNPPYMGSTWQVDVQKSEMQSVFGNLTQTWKSLDYVATWFMKAVEYGQHTNGAAAFVATKSICQGQQVPILWPLIFNTGHEIVFAHTALNWSNLASHNAGVTVVIVGLSRRPPKERRLYSVNDDGEPVVKIVPNINAYLVPGGNVIVNKLAVPPDDRAVMTWGNKPADGGNLIFNFDERRQLISLAPDASQFLRPFPGASEYIQGVQRYCLWIADDALGIARDIAEIGRRLDAVSKMRSESPKVPTLQAAKTPHRFVEIRQLGDEEIIVIPGISSQNRSYLQAGVLPKGTILSNKNYAFFGAPLWNMAVVASRLHLVWIATVCIRLRTDYSYSNTLGWNTFPIPLLKAQDKADLTRCAEDILLAREAHFPATIADLYDPDRMDKEFPDLRAAHKRNDETLERIYLGREFRNDTERLETLFKMYTEMTGGADGPKSAKRSPKRPKKG